MQRPTRIVVFGVLCLLIGGLSGMKNTMEAGLALVGPDGLEQVLEMAKQQQGLPQSSEQSLRVEIKAQRNPVYRVGQAIESVGSAFMALALIAAGVGLLRGWAWSLKLARWWAFYAIPAAGVSVVLTVRYAMPEMPDTTSGGGMINGAFMLVMLWVFPVLLLKQLPTESVKAYLAAREAHRTGTAARVGTPPVSPNTPSAGTAPSAPASTSPPSASPTNAHPTDTTWRDDPWNDPSSR